MSTQVPDRNPLELLQQRLIHLVETDPEVHAVLPDPTVQKAMAEPGLPAAEFIDIAMNAYADRVALGERKYAIVSDGAGHQVRQLAPDFRCVTYRELQAQMKALANAWRHNDKHRVAVDEFVIIVGFSGIDFVVADLATNYAQSVTVPIQTTLADEQIAGILKDCEPATVFTHISDLTQITRLVLEDGNINSLVVFDYDPAVDAEREAYEAAQQAIRDTSGNLQLTTLAELIAFGHTLPWEPLPPHPEGTERTAGLIHSSGSTGTPKGIISPERMMNFMWLGTGAPQAPTISTVFAPMNHFLGRNQVMAALTSGGKSMFTSNPDMSTLFEDIRLTRPTFLYFFPRVVELIYQHYQSEVTKRRERSGETVEVIDRQVRQEMHDGFLGNRLRAASLGSAPTPPEVKAFIAECFDILLIEGYGSTEGGIMSVQMGRIQRPPVIDYKLRDVPELGYYTTDKPYPRGEFLIKASTQAKGYFKRPEATQGLFDEDGYVITGDIMEERGPDHVVYIDRRNDVLKLSQAEFVAPGRLGSLFEDSPTIHQTYLYGNSTKPYLVAVVVPEMEVVEARLGPAPKESDIKTLLRSELLEVAKEQKLRTFEVPRDFLIEYEPFSMENGLLSNVRKRMRPKLKQKYGERLEALYEQLDQKRKEELDALRNPDSDMTVLEKVVKALEATLSIEGVAPDTEQSFAQLGGDSLGSVSFAAFLQDIFGVDVPVNAIVSPAGNPARWARDIEKLLAGESTGVVSFETIHGAGATELYARDLDINNFLDEDTLNNIPTTMPQGDSKTVLITGSNGFLGHFVCLEWLEKVAQSGGKVIALIRANSNESARARLDAKFAGVDGELERHYQSLAGQHLEVLAADLGEYHFGLGEDQWQRLAGEVDHIVHIAALVNHVLPYQHLFGPNVYGTAGLVNLALTTRLKRFDFVSSTAVAEINAAFGELAEDSPLPESLPLSDGYAAGYGTSKWANEVQLHSAHRRYGLPVNIFRGDMMMPHSRYKGQINETDMVTRLLYSIVMTGLAPASFYEPGPDGGRARAHYDGLPCEIIAGTVTGTGAKLQEGIRTFHTINYHWDDGISLDSIVDWVQSAGYSVEREPDHAVWYKRFGEKLAAMTEAQRQHSSVSILHQFQQPFPASHHQLGSANFEKAVQGLPFGPTVPQLTEKYIHKYLNDMQLLSMIPAPGGK
jgi:fatty acid CoA ligase FadD9